MGKIVLLATGSVVFLVMAILMVIDLAKDNIRLATGPEISNSIQPEYPFQAKLITRPDHGKQMQWTAVPLTYGWKDTILVDFDYGGGMDLNFILKEGDVVNLIGMKSSTGEWYYRHDDQYWIESVTKSTFVNRGTAPRRE